MLQDGQTFLMTACQYGEQVIIEELLTQGENELITEKIDVNAVDNVSTEKIICTLLTKVKIIYLLRRIIGQLC